MKLTKRVKEEFEKWYISSDGYKIKGWENMDWRKYPYPVFDRMDDSMQYGVYVDYFDSVSVYIEDMRDDENGYFYSIFYKGSVYEEAFKTRPQAREKAIDLFDGFIWYVICSCGWRIPILHAKSKR